MILIKRAVAIVALTSLLQFAPEEKFKKLFNGKDFSGWYTWVDGYGKNQDPLRVFKIEPGGIIHISGEKFGYLCTTSEFTNFHIKLEFKWGEKRWEPRLTAKRDSGLLYLIPADSVDKIWPCGIECQVQEGDTGDFWMISNPTIVVDGVRTKPGGYIRSIKKRDAEKPNGEWNSVEVIIKDGHCQHFVNGVLVNEGFNASIPKGKLLIQSEGAEIFYKNIVLRKL
jgi:hypothetical protein